MLKATLELNRYNAQNHLFSSCRATRRPKSTLQLKVKLCYHIVSALLHYHYQVCMAVSIYCISCVCCRAEGRNCGRLLEDGLGAAVVYYRHGNPLRRGKQGKYSSFSSLLTVVLMLPLSALYRLHLFLICKTGFSLAVSCPACRVKGQVCAVLALSRP